MPEVEGGDHSECGWGVEEIEFDDWVVRARLTDGNVEIEMIACVLVEGRLCRLYDCHFLGPGPNQVGPRRLRALAQWVKRELDVDELRIEGAVRTSGAGPGRRPRPLVF